MIEVSRVDDSKKHRAYIHRHTGDVIKNGAILVRRINGQKWEIKCKCGKTFINQPSDTSGLCWDCSHKAVAQSHTKHNESPDTGKKASRLYRIWLGMKARCYIPTASGYKCYGARGIKVCPEWNDYLAFKNWALLNGYKENLTIERKDVNGDYEPGNCCWITHKEQMQNTRKTIKITYNGETKSVSEWAEKVGLRYSTLKRRIRSDEYTIEEALNIPFGMTRKEYRGMVK